MNGPSRPRPSLLTLLIAELKRRGVLRAASLYCVCAWVAIQALGEASDAFDLPRQVVAGAMVLAMIGLPVVVMVSWLYRLGLEAEDVPQDVGMTGGQLRAGVAGAILFGVVLLGVSGWIALRPRADEAAAGPAAGLGWIAVLEFVDLTGDPAQAYLATALTGTLIDQLSTVDGLSVISREGVAPYRDRQVPLDSIARALGVGTLVTGSVLHGNGRLRVSAALIDPQTGKVLKPVLVDTPAVDPMALVYGVVRDVADSLRSQLGREVRLREWEYGTRNHDAWRLLQQAVQHRDRAQHLRANGDFAAALATLGQADSLLDAAVRLDGGYHEALVMQAMNAYPRALMLLRLDRGAVTAALQAGEERATRVLKRDWRNAGAYEARGVLRELRHVLVPPEDAGEARALLVSAEQDLREAIEIEPVRVRALQSLSAVLDQRGAFAEALYFLEEAYRLDAFHENAEGTVDRLFTINFELLRDEEAARWCAELRRRAGPEIRTAACELQLLAWSGEGAPDVDSARTIAEAALAYQRSARGGASPKMLDVLVAGVMARAGMADSARARLEGVNALAANAPDLLQLEAGVRVLLGEYDSAVALLRSYAAAASSPALLGNSRRFASLPVNPLVPAPLRR